ncbi:insulinase family protein [Mitsuaria sp. GD03876]|uniref:M16 family metallopeptidase n=1 Tax=Mitsuaria sp. GD03876 TaxID=2975399 RepID=UPI00244B3D17|nr:insulinase family protein [Mitsuaria sp. GD03876]MDH0863773.1 insulinase family protein [Mitsuaria sp. GD03876]
MSPSSLEPQRLPNGLLWLARPVAGAQAAVRVVYRCGGRDDPTGRSGLSHLVLRLVAGASRNLAPGQFHRLIAASGGRSRIEIDEDFAALQTVVPAHQLERLLWAEAERMSNPRLDPDTLASARLQLRQAVQEPQLNPYARLDLAVQRHGYLTHPYQRGALGDPEQLKDLDIDAVRAFHAARFGCDRALLVVTGAFDEGALARWVMHYFGSIRPPMPVTGASLPASMPASGGVAGSASTPAAAASPPMPPMPGSAASSPASAALAVAPAPMAAPAAPAASLPPMPAEPRELRESRRPQNQTLKLSLAQAPLPAAALVWQVPRADDPSLPMWQMARALLGLGRSGRLTDTLVDEKALAHQLSLRLDQHRDAGLLVAQALAAHGQTAAPLAQALQQEVLRLADEPVTDEELDKAKAMLRRETLSAQWTADRLARALGTAWAVRGDAGAPAKDMAVWVKLTGVELQQFWRKQVVQAPVLTLLADIGAAAGVAA